jgi:hypothetical protein
MQVREELYAAAYFPPGQAPLWAMMMLGNIVFDVIDPGMAFLRLHIRVHGSICVQLPL